MSRETKACPMCGEMILDVAQKCRYCGEYMSGARRRRRRVSNEGLTSNEYLLYSVLFFVIPCVNVIASSCMYYSWKERKPRKAQQINQLGFIVFGIHVAIRVVIMIAFRV